MIGADPDGGFGDRRHVVGRHHDGVALAERVLDQQLAAAGPFVMGRSFTISDIPVGLVVNRWFSVNFQKPEFKAVSAYYDRLTERPAYRAHGRNGTP